jgi:hypothetical protein
MRVAVVFEPGRGGAAAIDAARELAEHEYAALTVFSVVPQGASSCCAGSAVIFNEAIQDAGKCELREARERLGDAGEDVELKLLIEGTDPPLEDLIATGGFELVLLPARRRMLHAAKHPAAARLGRSTAAEVRIVERS